MSKWTKTMRDALAEMSEAFSKKQIKMAIGIASDKRYAGGNMTGAVKQIEKLKKGLSDHPQVAAVLKRQNEDVELDEGRMKELHGYIEKGMSAQEIAKKMKLDVKTIKALMPEEVEADDALDNLIEEALVEEVEEVEEHTHYKMDNFGNSVSLLDAVNAVLSGNVKRENIPEEILDDDVADFIGAASKAAQAGKKTFKFGDKEYPVTIKKDTAKKVASKMEEKDSEDKKMKDKKDEKMGKKEPIEIDPTIKEDAEKMILREQYDEEMFECRANGIETMSFSNWQKRKILLAELFSK